MSGGKLIVSVWCGVGSVDVRGVFGLL